MGSICFFGKNLHLVGCAKSEVTLPVYDIQYPLHKDEILLQQSQIHFYFQLSGKSCFLCTSLPVFSIIESFLILWKIGFWRNYHIATLSYIWQNSNDIFLYGNKYNLGRNRVHLEFLELFPSLLLNMLSLNYIQGDIS